jgi:hypothetical protein
MEHLDFNSHTYEFAARFRPDGTESPKGAATLEVLPRLNDEALQNGREKTYRCLVQAVNEVVAGTKTRDEFSETIRDNGQYGLAQWFFLGAGADEGPFATLRDAHADLWAEAREAARTAS